MQKSLYNLADSIAEWGTDGQRIAIMGAGSWGTTLAKVCADAGNGVRLWARREELAREIMITRENKTYLPGLTLPNTVSATSDPAQALRGANIVILAIPSGVLRQNLAEWRDLIHTYCSEDVSLLSLVKGIEKGTDLRMSELISEVADIEPHRVAALSGPNLAREIALEQPSATLIACPDLHRAHQIADALATKYFRTFVTTDVIGCEIGGACKNVIALACGMAAGMKYGENTQASIITRGLAEITRLGEHLGADPRTFAGLAGMGDLVATCSSPLSRNRTFGYRLGMGDTIEEARKATNGQVAEGFHSSRSIWELANHQGVNMPIVEAVYGVCHESKPVENTIEALMTDNGKIE
ncbi:MAG: NAD(P)H-dependent glycerol-3-phosphate dehydrogenase [Corynebacterium sp.]|nr:NAD(P)H-dependent glycerol-3-phosphate dehydrogenase [Corynebacterium sp.]